MTNRILIVDDSALSRRMLSEAVTSDSALEVAYAAPTAELGIGFLEKNDVDLIVLDVEMPKVDGIEAVRRIRRKWEKIPILMCSGHTAQGANVTLKALAEGASDCISKPNIKFPVEQFTVELVGKINALVRAAGGADTAEAPTAAKPARVEHKLRSSVGASTAASVRALAIGCSTGGPNALATFFSEFYRPSPLPLFIVQHMPPVFTTLLAERLSAQSGQLVKEGEHGELVRPGVCYLAPGGYHMVVVRSGVQMKIELNEDPAENFCRPAVDVLFRSLAATYGGSVLATVLTGMGQDGALSTVTLADAGARVLAQEPSTCVVPSMPNGVIKAGAAHAVLTLQEIAREFDQAGRAGGVIRQKATVGAA
jgi:two-component system chemotaxis response regulator CheB